MVIREIKCKSVLNKTGIEGLDYVINPYVGCGHGCKYCYASFMKRYTNHVEEWGHFVDVKINSPKILEKELIRARGGIVLLSSVTDPYQPIEKKYQLTRKILRILLRTKLYTTILTKSSLVLRDLDVLKGFNKDKVDVGFTINYLSEEDKRNWEPNSSSISERILALEKIHKIGIRTYVHVGPCFLGITDLEEILERVSPFIQEFQVEGINFKGPKKDIIRKTIREKYPHLIQEYESIFKNPENYKMKIRKKVEKLREKYPIKISYFV